MIRFAIGGALLLSTPCLLAQTSSPATQFVAARQPEVERMAEIFYNTHLDKGAWARHDLPECAVLTHHAFVRFDGTLKNGTAASFLAIYDLDHAPARTKDQPWQGGVTLVRVAPAQQDRQDAGPSPDYLIVAFNRALQQEHKTSVGGASQTVSSAEAVARCFISVNGNFPEQTEAHTGAALSPEASHQPLSGVMIPLSGSSASARIQYVNFDKDGSILEAGVSLTPR